MMHRRRLDLLLLAAFSVGTIIASNSHSDDRPIGDSTRPATQGRKGLLVLVNGRIVEGKIEETPSGFLVELASGRYLVPFERVRYEAKDRRDAYRKQRKFLTKPSPRDHVSLAGWCIAYGLYDEAQVEVRDALRMSPSNPDARRMLVNLEEIRNPGDPVNRQTAPGIERNDDGFEPGNVSTLGGLERETGQNYVRRIQPLLMNRCGNASCHGSAAKNDFRLERVHLGYTSHRGPTERNLAILRKYIDAKSPDRSPLLTAPSDSRHGGSRRDVFFGSTGIKQREMLAEWIQRVAEELPDTSVAEVKSTGDALQASSAKTKKTPRTAPSNDPFLRKILLEERPDPFDPAAFNRANRTRNPTRGTSARRSR